MMDTVIIILSVLIVGICFLMNGITELGKKMEKMEDNINFLHQRIDAILSNTTNIQKNILGNISNNPEPLKGDEK